MSLFENYQNSDTEIEIDYEKDIISEQIVNLLTDVMRKQYCSYLEKLLMKNFETWCNKNIGIDEKPPQDWIKKCVQMYEMKAIKSCMIAQFYRKSMLKIMESIRKSTINRKLDKKMKLYSESSDRTLHNNYYPYCLDASVQTIKINLNSITTQTNIEHLKNDNKKFTINNPLNQCIKITNDIQENIVDTSGCIYGKLSLDEKIELFKDRIINIQPDNNYDKESANKRKRCPLSPQKQNHKKIIVNDKKIINTFTNSNPTCLSVLEQLTHNDSTNETLINNGKEIETIESKEDDIAKELDKIFCDEETDFNDIFGLSENYTTPEKISKDEQLPNNIVKNENEKIVTETKDCTISKNIIKQPTTKIIHDNRLRDSIWPCELHMQTKRLREILSDVGNIFGMRFHEKVKLKFIELFGNDDNEDDFAPYSPSMEINDILLSSCKARIAPWIVKYLMIPMKDGLIKDRLVFKKFAKRMANKIVILNQYPSEIDIKDTIADYFILNKKIDVIEDIDIT